MIDVSFLINDEDDLKDNVPENSSDLEKDESALESFIFFIF